MRAAGPPRRGCRRSSRASPGALGRQASRVSAAGLVGRLDPASARARRSGKSSGWSSSFGVSAQACSIACLSSRTLPGNGSLRTRSLASADSRRGNCDFREDPQEVVREEELVVAAFAERRHPERDDGEAVVEVVAKRSAADGGLDVEVRGREDPHVDVDVAVVPDAADLELLERAEDLGLRGERHRADSSRRSVPPSASSKRPRRAFVAPLNAPRTCPKSSLSMRSSGMAAQLSVTNGLPARGPKDAMYFATTSLPVPVSPRIRTVEEARRPASRARGGSSTRGSGRPRSSAPSRASTRRKPSVVLMSPREARDDVEEALDPERLHEEVGGAGLHRLDRVGNGGLARHDDERDGGRPASTSKRRSMPERPGSMRAEKIRS